MKRSLSASVRAIAFAVGALVLFPTFAEAQTAPLMGGGFSDVIPIPVDDPATKNIAGALFKPKGGGPFRAVVYMPACGGFSYAPDVELAKTVVDHLLAKGIATLIVDPFMPRNEWGGICGQIIDPNLNQKEWVQYGARGGRDAAAAVKVLRSMADIDPNRIFLQGYSYGATSSLSAVELESPGANDAKIAGVIAYYPFCLATQILVPALILIGEKDDWTPAALCQAVKDKPNIEVVVYPGVTHAFVYPSFGQWGLDYGGHHMVYDETATLDAQARADAFMDSHMK